MPTDLRNFRVRVVIIVLSNRQPAPIAIQETVIFIINVIERYCLYKCYIFVSNFIIYIILLFIIYHLIIYYSVLSSSELHL